MLHRSDARKQLGTAGPAGGEADGAGTHAPVSASSLRSTRLSGGLCQGTGSRSTSPAPPPCALHGGIPGRPVVPNAVKSGRGAGRAASPLNPQCRKSCCLSAEQNTYCSMAPRPQRLRIIWHFIRQPPEPNVWKCLLGRAGGFVSEPAER